MVWSVSRAHASDAHDVVVLAQGREAAEHLLADGRDVLWAETPHTAGQLDGAQHGIEIAERTHVVALGISTDGVKIPLGLWEGSTENATLARTLLSDLVDRGLDPEQAILFVIDGAKALRRAIKDVFGEHALVHRCHRHKERNVTDLLPERDRPVVRTRMRAAWTLGDPELARQRLELLASELERSWPDAAASLREGMEDTLTLMGLGIEGRLHKTLCSTNPCESMIEIVRYTQRNVKRWQDGDMRKRWTAAGMLVAEQQFRRIIGYRHLATLVIAIERHTILVAAENHNRQENRELVTV
jgi:putative transposase